VKRAIAGAVLLAGCTAGPTHTTARATALSTPTSPTTFRLPRAATLAPPKVHDPLALVRFICGGLRPAGQGIHGGRALPPVVTAPASGTLRAIYICAIAPGRHHKIYVTLLRATTGLDALSSDLRRPDQPAPSGTFACTQNAIILPVITVTLADGLSLRPRLPMSACGEPLAGVLADLSSVRTQTVASEPQLSP
jgi:hypothetical protein